MFDVPVRLMGRDVGGGECRNGAGACYGLLVVGRRPEQATRGSGGM